MADHLLKLDAAGTSLVVRLAPYPEIVYWGARLEAFEAGFAISLAYPVPNGRLEIQCHARQ